MKVASGEREVRVIYSRPLNTSDEAAKVDQGALKAS